MNTMNVRLFRSYYKGMLVNVINRISTRLFSDVSPDKSAKNGPTKPKNQVSQYNTIGSVHLTCYGEGGLAVGHVH